jgi:hypothetical protein
MRSRGLANLIFIDQPNNVRSRVQIIKFLIMQYLPLSRYYIHLNKFHVAVLFWWADSSFSQEIIHITSLLGAHFLSIVFLNTLK